MKLMEAGGGVLLSIKDGKSSDASLSTKGTKCSKSMSANDTQGKSSNDA